MNEWINVKNRCPDKNGSYLVVVSGYNKPYIELLNYSKCLSESSIDFQYNSIEDYNRSGWWMSDSECDFERTGVLYWMPLPDLPNLDFSENNLD